MPFSKWDFFHPFPSDWWLLEGKGMSDRTSDIQLSAWNMVRSKLE